MPAVAVLLSANHPRHSWVVAAAFAVPVLTIVASAGSLGTAIDCYPDCTAGEELAGFAIFGAPPAIVATAAASVVAHFRRKRVTRRQAGALSSERQR